MAAQRRPCLPLGGHVLSVHQHYFERPFVNAAHQFYVERPGVSDGVTALNLFAQHPRAAEVNPPPTASPKKEFHYALDVAKAVRVRHAIHDDLVA